MAKLCMECHLNYVYNPFKHKSPRYYTELEETCWIKFNFRINSLWKTALGIDPGKIETLVYIDETQNLYLNLKTEMFFFITKVRKGLDAGDRKSSY